MGSRGTSNSASGIGLDWVEWDGGIDENGNWATPTNESENYETERKDFYTKMLSQNGAFGDWELTDREKRRGMDWEWAETMGYDFQENYEMYPRVPAVGLARWQMGAWEKGYGEDRQAFDREYGISKFIDNAKSMHLNTNNNLYRGVKANAEGIEQLRNAMANGDTISMNGLSSWSSMRGMAEQFTRTSLVSPSSGQIKPLVFVDTTKGVRNSIPYPYSRQAEVLSSGTTRYTVQNIREREGITYVIVQQVKR